MDTIDSPRPRRRNDNDNDSDSDDKAGAMMVTSGDDGGKKPKGKDNYHQATAGRVSRCGHP